MTYFLLLLTARLRVLLRSGGLWITTLFFLGITLLCGTILPRSQPQAMAVGLVAESQMGIATAAHLAENTDYQFIAYDSREALEQDVITGMVHCGYLLGSGRKPITGLATSQSYMRPLVDELVLAAWNEAEAPALTQQFLDENRLVGNAEEQMAALAKTTRPMTVELVTIGQATPITTNHTAVQPLLYAVMISAFLAASILGVTLLDEGEQRALRQLAGFSGRPLATHSAGVLAWVLVNLVVLLTADGLVSLLLGDSAYPLAQRLPMLALLTLMALVFGLAGSLLRRYAGVVALLLPPALLVSILCSGAIISPQLLPGGLSLLRFLSPAWYLLQLLQ